MHKKASRALTRDVFSALLRQELHRPAAETFVHAVGDGEDGAPAGAWRSASSTRDSVSASRSAVIFRSVISISASVGKRL